LAEAVARQIDAAWFLDWGGGLAWLAVPEAGDGGAAIIRGAVGGDGHATLVKGSSGLRREVPVFEPQPASLASLSRRVKDGFDPRRILNPGRMVDGV
jgi:glycolate oxidase FAD binding subunit